MKFGVVGVIATVIDFGIINLLHYVWHQYPNCQHQRLYRLAHL